MKSIQNKLIILFLITFVFPQFGASQDSSTYDFSYEMNRVYKPLSIAKETITEAQTLSDLNRHYKPSWIRTYLSVEIMVSHKGSIKKALSKNDTLSQEQKNLLAIADESTDLAVKVEYIPENTLSQNDSKEINFSFMVNPEKEATYIGGQQELKKYLKNKGIDEISDTSIDIYNLAAVKFTIDEQGKVVDAQVAQTSKEEKVDELLLEAICNMPNWQPAEYANGLKVKQEFVLTIGDHRSCVINLLNIRRLPID